MSAIYIYYYKTDSSREPIGRFNAETMDEALERLSVIKQLSVELVDNLFVIECVKGGRDDDNI